MPAQLQAGDLDRRITFQRVTVTTGGAYNEPQEVWSDLVAVRAKRTDASAAEGYRAAEVGTQISTRFTVRWSSLVSSVSPLDRLVFEGRTFNITGVREVAGATRQWIEIDAVARGE